MKQVINSKLYDTDEAELIATYCPVADSGNFSYLKESLYKTEKGNYFLQGTGGPNTKYAVRHNGSTSGSSEIEPMDEADALEWCQDRTVDAEVIMNEFNESVEKA